MIVGGNKMKNIKYYLNSSREYNHYIWIDRINDEVDEPNKWHYAFYEVEFDVVVDEITGEYYVNSAKLGNGQTLLPP